MPRFIGPWLSQPGLIRPWMIEPGFIEPGLTEPTLGTRITESCTPAVADPAIKMTTAEMSRGSSTPLRPHPFPGHTLFSKMFLFSIISYVAIFRTQAALL